MSSLSGDTPPRQSAPDHSRERDIRILEAVDRITSSGVLGAGDRMPALLAYLVREELAGRGERIKSFSIATEVLGRGQDFDPQSDSIARAEMTRLRKAVAHYNATLGANSAVTISIPKGSYRPTIVFAKPAEWVPLPSPEPVEAKSQIAHRVWIVAIGLVCMLGLAGVALFGDARVPGWRAAPAQPLPPLLVMQPPLALPSDRLTLLNDGLQDEIAAE